MAIAKVIEISSESTKGFEDTIQQGIASAAETLHGHSRRMGEGAAGRRTGHQDHRLSRRSEGDLCRHGEPLEILETRRSTGRSYEGTRRTARDKSISL